MATKFPVLVFNGPRQSGKTTLAKMAFPDYRYVSLENPDSRNFALKDPKGFLDAHNAHVILDEVQNSPELFSYIQQMVDDSGMTGQFILSGSHNFLLHERITQTLSGRVYRQELLPLSYEELREVDEQEILKLIIHGGYPRIYDKEIQPGYFFPSYIDSYIERDIRSLKNIHNLSLFKKFMIMLAHYNGQLFNAHEISKKLGINSKTIQDWFSLLKASYIVFDLPPWYRNFSKRLVKSPKLYFYDTGLVAHLLGVRKPEQLVNSPYKGPLFENFIILEMMKAHINRSIDCEMYFWRDNHGNEIDLILESGPNVSCIEIKASSTVKQDYIDKLHYLDGREASLNISHYLAMMIGNTQYRSSETILSWKDCSSLVNLND